MVIAADLLTETVVAEHSASRVAEERADSVVHPVNVGAAEASAAPEASDPRAARPVRAEADPEVLHLAIRLERGDRVAEVLACATAMDLSRRALLAVVALQRSDLDADDVRMIYYLAGESSDIVRRVIAHPRGEPLWEDIAAAPRRPMHLIVLARHQAARRHERVRPWLEQCGVPVVWRYLLRDLGGSSRASDRDALWGRLCEAAPREAVHFLEEIVAARVARDIPTSAIQPLQLHRDDTVRLRVAPILRDRRAAARVGTFAAGSDDTAPLTAVERTTITSGVSRTGETGRSMKAEVRRAMATALAS